MTSASFRNILSSRVNSLSQSHESCGAEPSSLSRRMRLVYLHGVAGTVEVGASSMPPQSPPRPSPEMDDQQNDADSDQNLARQRQPRMGSAGQHEKQADYRGPAS